MEYKLLIDDLVWFNVSESIDFYNSRSEGLGARFYNSVLSAFSSIQLRPETFPIKRTPFREALLKTFPFVIIFTFDAHKGEIIIFDVFHTSQNPKKKP